MGVSEETLSRAANGNTSIELMGNIANALCAFLSFHRILLNLLYIKTFDVCPIGGYSL